LKQGQLPIKQRKTKISTPKNKKRVAVGHPTAGKVLKEQQPQKLVFKLNLLTSFVKRGNC